MAGQLLPIATTPGRDLPPALMAKLRAKAEAFEATTLGQLLQPMFDTVDTAHGLFGGGAGEQMWKPMMVTEIAKQIAHAGGVGLAQPVLQTLIQAQEASARAPNTRPTTQRNGDAE